MKTIFAAMEKGAGMRDRLASLLSEAEGLVNNDLPTVEQIADYLIEHGVIVPPCKVGDAVYFLTEASCESIDGVYTVCEHYVCGEDDMLCNLKDGEKCPYQYRIMKGTALEMNIFMIAREIGKTVFLTREEAEKALAERSEP